MLDLFCDAYIYRADIHQPDKMLYVFQLLSLKGKPIDFQCGDKYRLNCSFLGRPFPYMLTRFL